MTALDLDLATLQSEVSPRRSARPGPIIVCCFLVIGAVIACSVFTSLISPYSPSADNLLYGLHGPSAAHLLGTDDLGRDILSRIIAGSRTALVGPAVVAAGAMVIGSVLGLIAGSTPGVADTLVMRLMDMIWALPTMLIAIVVLGVVGGGYPVAVALLIVLTCPADTRIVRAATLEQCTLPYIEAVRTLNVSKARMLCRHVWPNLIPLVVANTFLNFAFSLVALSSLSFLGLGVRPTTPDWGVMLSQNIALLQGNALALLAPALAVVLTATSMNLLGDWFYERLSARGRTR
jgi:peptide/nickel transport system permease protein